MKRFDPRDATELGLGMRGTLGGDAFELVGRTHVVSRGGARWNEWRAVLASGREGWLAEAAGRFYFFFEAPLVEVAAAPPGASVSARWVVVERDHARRVLSYGDAPPCNEEEEYRYVDLSGPEGRVATVDYGGDIARTFTGKCVTLDEIGLTAAREPVYPAVSAGARPKSEMAVGGTVLVQNTSYKLIATLVRSEPDDDARFVWEEHLLYRKGAGLVWLVELPDERRLADPVEPGAVDVRDGSARYDGRKWKKVHSALARTDGALGAMPWLPRVGEESRSIDYARKDRTLSVEHGEREVACAVSSPLDEAEVVYAPPKPARK